MKTRRQDSYRSKYCFKWLKKCKKNQPIGKLQEKAESGQDTNIQIALLQKQVINIEINIAKKMN